MVWLNWYKASFIIGTYFQYHAVLKIIRQKIRYKSVLYYFYLTFWWVFYNCTTLLNLIWYHGLIWNHPKIIIHSPTWSFLNEKASFMYLLHLGLYTNHVDNKRGRKKFLCNTQTLDLFPRNLCEDFFLKIGILR